VALAFSGQVVRRGAVGRGVGVVRLGGKREVGFSLVVVNGTTQHMRVRLLGRSSLPFCHARYAPGHGDGHIRLLHQRLCDG